ncbi:hypothetical protein LshimejAT787_0200220 [Lyophyllum shimeji]|uniref:Uncharacterized protein n=1 Tax=Lyophyllum shimeji TaxID=47721 RepID=A0A9P3PFG7_LYOSH|nr:hypothetical protein LshimejAT787_0200220 [Lyophyllum shimeji]
MGRKEARQRGSLDRSSVSRDSQEVRRAPMSLHVTPDKRPMQTLPHNPQQLEPIRTHASITTLARGRVVVTTAWWHGLVHHFFWPALL